MRSHKNRPTPERRIAPITREGKSEECPTKHKVAYATRKDAKRFLKLWRANHGHEPCRLSVYLCMCGAFHIGRTHPAGRAKNRTIAQAKMLSQ